MRSRIDELLPIAEENEGFVTAVQARSLGIKGSVLARLTQRGTWDLVNSRFARLKMQSGADCFPTRTQGEQNVPAVLPAVGLSCNDFQ
jgi:hypothetical protein